MPPHPPSLHALRAFEAAARHGGFKLAAEELHVTPTAISHHIRGLEANLNTPLFFRRTRTVQLTEAGQRLASACTAAFISLDNAVAAARPRTHRQTVTIALGPFLASRWLTGRLPKFWQAFPGVDLRLLHTPVRIDPGMIDADICIAWGDGRWPGSPSRLFVRIAATPVASPRLVARLGWPDTPASLAGYPLIHQRDTSAWTDWLAIAGAGTTDIREGTVIEDANVVLRSVVEGHGVALGWLPLINDEIEAGRLKQLFDDYLNGPLDYYLIEPRARTTAPITREVIDWLITEVTSP